MNRSGPIARLVTTALPATLWHAALAAAAQASETCLPAAYAADTSEDASQLARILDAVRPALAEFPSLDFTASDAPPALGLAERLDDSNALHSYKL